jgi:6-phosphofructokinase 1
MSPLNILYAQSGGVTAVINASAAEVIRGARARRPQVGAILAARRGILGLIHEELVDTDSFDDAVLRQLARRPGGVFGSSRYDLPAVAEAPALYARIFAVLAAHRIGAFLYNGGNGSMDVVAKLSAEARTRGYPLVCIGVPKTVDNDIEGTDCCPGFGSAAKFLATSMLEAGLDIGSMAARVGRVFVMEVMGRNVGWLAAATALAARDTADGESDPDQPPHVVLLPEAGFDEARFLDRVREVVQRVGYCAITVAEGLTRDDGSPIMEQSRDAKGYVQLGGAGGVIARLIHERLGYKYHWAVPDYLQRAAGHWVSATDHAQAGAVGLAAVEYALAGRDGVMASIRRLADSPYRWEVVAVAAGAVANLERRLPEEFIHADGLHVSAEARSYLRPLIEGELPVPTAGGLPDYRPFRLPLLPKKLPAWPS